MDCGVVEAAVAEQGKREQAERPDMGGGGAEGVAVAEDWINVRAEATRGLTCSRRWRGRPEQRRTAEQRYRGAPEEEENGDFPRTCL
jgi:hypothetical protein